MTYYYIQLIINGIALGSVYSLIALGFTLIFSVLKFSNFSHGGVMVVSAYFAYIVCKSWNLGFVPMILITVLLADACPAWCSSSALSGCAEPRAVPCCFLSPLPSWAPCFRISSF